MSRAQRVEGDTDARNDSALRKMYFEIFDA